MKVQKIFGLEQTHIAVMLLLLLCSTVYFNSIFGDFLLDDEMLIQKNPAIHSLWNIDKVTYRWARTFSYAIDYFFWGLNPIGYHLSNIFYNTLTVIVVFLLTKRLTGIFFVSLITALIFALHPIHTEAVSYLSGRRDILSALFYLLGFLAYLYAREKRKWWSYALVVVCYITAISSKEMAVTLPLCIFAYEVLQTMVKKPEGFLLPLFLSAVWTNLKRFKLAISVVTVLMVVYLYLVLFLQHASGMVTSDHINWWGGTVVSNFATITCVMTAYIQKLFFPIVLQIDYRQFPYYSSFLHRDVLLSITVILSLLAFSFVMIRRNWRATFLIWFFFITLLPVMHIIPHHMLMAEHYLYLPSYSFCLAAAMAANYLYRNKRFRVALFLLLVLLNGIFFIRTVDRNSDWIDTITLMKEGLEHDPKNPVYHFFLGRAYNLKHLSISASRELAQAVSDRYNDSKIHAVRAVVAYKRGDYEEGEKKTEEALRLDPKDQMALFNRGLFALMMGDKEKALQSYSRVRPDYEQSSHLQNMAAIYLERGELDQAETLLSNALKLYPERPEFHYGMAEVLAKRLEFGRAEEKYVTALRLGGEMPEFKKYLEDAPEKIRWSQKLQDESIEATRLLSEDPLGAKGHYILGKIYWDILEYDKAEQELRKAVEAEEHNLETEIFLGKTLIKRGKVVEAEALFERLLKNPSSSTSLMIPAGEIFAQLLKLDRAVQVYSDAVKRNMDDSDLMSRLAELKKILGLWNQSETLAAKGETVDAKIFKGDVYKFLGQYKKAIAEYESALENDPDNIEILNHLAGLYHKMDYPYRAKAIRTYRRILELTPSNAEAYRRLGKLFYYDVEDYESALEYFQKAVDLGLDEEDPNLIEITDTLKRFVRDCLH